MIDTKQSVLDKIRAQLNATHNLAVVDGALGDMQDCGGLLEEVVTNDEGIFCKWYGCSYLFKGYPDKNVIEGLGLAKAMISAIPRELVAKNIPIALGVVFNFLFRRKKFVHLCHVWFSTIYVNEIYKLGMKPEKYGKPVKELRRVAYLDLKEKEGWGLLHGDFRAVTGEETDELIANVVEFISVFLELDSAYRFRVQDALGNISKANLEKDVVKEIARIFSLMISRENTENVRQKIVHLSRLIKLFLTLSPKVRAWTKSFLLQLDVEKVKLDESDWYFCLRRNNYNFGGLAVEERLKEKERIDIEKGHVMLKFTQSPQGLEINVQ